MSDAAAAPVLLASVLGDDTGGGVYVPGAAIEAATVDDLSTVGMAVADDGATLARLVWTDDDPQTAGELLLYHARGVRVPVPERPGVYRLRVAVGQEGLGWLGPETGAPPPRECTLEVTAARRSG
jgi:hypothetical protein